VSVQKKYVALMSLRAYRAAELVANMPEDNIVMKNTEMAFISMVTEPNFLNI
jgi:hypothetical protein